MQLRNVDLWGADLADMAARTYADCCAACTIWPGCGAFTFAPSQSRCYLKGSSGWELKRADGMASALMEGGSSSGGSGGNGGTVSPPVTVPSPSPSPSPSLPSPSPSPPPPPPPSPRPSPSPSPRPSPSPSPAPQGPPVKQPPGAGTSVPRINLGRMADGSEPKVLQVRVLLVRTCGIQSVAFVCALCWQAWSFKGYRQASSCGNACCPLCSSTSLPCA